MSSNEYKDVSPWFMHDSNAKDDPKIMLVIDQLGLEGFGIYWTAVETLREQKDYKYPLKLISSLARKYNTSQVKFETVVKEYGLFEIDKNDSFFSLSLCRRMSKLDEVKAKKRLGGKRSGVTRKKQSEERLKQLRLLNSSEDSSNTHQTDIEHNRTNITQHNITQCLYEREDWEEIEIQEMIKNFSHSNELDGFLHDYIESLNININSPESYIHKLRTQLFYNDKSTTTNLFAFYQKQQLEGIKNAQ